MSCQDKHRGRHGCRTDIDRHAPRPTPTKCVPLMERLPTDVLLHVAAFLPLPTLVPLSNLNRHFRATQLYKYRWRGLLAWMMAIGPHDTLDSLRFLYTLSPPSLWAEMAEALNHLHWRETQHKRRFGIWSRRSRRRVRIDTRVTHAPTQFPMVHTYDCNQVQRSEVLAYWRWTTAPAHTYKPCVRWVLPGRCTLVRTFAQVRWLKQCRCANALVDRE